MEGPLGSPTSGETDGEVDLTTCTHLKVAQAERGPPIPCPKVKPSYKCHCAAFLHPVGSPPSETVGGDVMARVGSLLALLACISITQAADWPQWLGPRRDASSPEKVV